MTNALNGALLARRPDHYKNFTVVGIMLMALLMGLGGGITRDVLLNKLPGALSNPAYILLALVAGIIGYSVACTSGQLFREGHGVVVDKADRAPTRVRFRGGEIALEAAAAARTRMWTDVADSPVRRTPDLQRSL